MLDEVPRCPCNDCSIHMLGLDKKDPRFPCFTGCQWRLEYAAAVTEYQPAKFVDSYIYDVSTDSIDIFELLNGR